NVGEEIGHDYRSKCRWNTGRDSYRRRFAALDGKAWRKSRGHETRRLHDAESTNDRAGCAGERGINADGEATNYVRDCCRCATESFGSSTFARFVGPAARLVEFEFHSAETQQLRYSAIHIFPISWLSLRNPLDRLRYAFRLGLGAFGFRDPLRILSPATRAKGRERFRGQPVLFQSGSQLQRNAHRSLRRFPWAVK